MGCIYTGALQRLYRAGDLWTSFLPGPVACLLYSSWLLGLQLEGPHVLRGCSMAAASVRLPSHEEGVQGQAGAMVLWKQANCMRFSAALSTPLCCKGVGHQKVAHQDIGKAASSGQCSLP